MYQGCRAYQIADVVAANDQDLIFFHVSDRKIAVKERSLEATIFNSDDTLRKLCHEAGFMRLLVGVIARAHQWAAGRMAKAHGQRFLLELVEARRLDVAQHR